MLPFMMGLTWASTVIPPIEHGMIVEGILIQTSSEKHIARSDHSSFMTSLRNGSLRGLEGAEGTVGLREGSVRRLWN